MGLRAKDIAETRDVGVVLLFVAFVINGTSNPLVAANIGDEIQGQQVTRTGAGVFTFALNDTVSSLLGVFPGGVFGASGDVVPQCTAAGVVAGGANSITVKTLTAAAGADPANGSIVSLLIAVKKNTRRASQS